PLDDSRSLARNYSSPSCARLTRARGASALPDDKRFVPDFQLVVDGQAADPELKGSIVGIRVTDDMDKASRFWLHLSDVGRKWTRQQKFKPGTAIEIKLGYQGQLKSVCKGEVSNIEIVLTADGPSRLVVAGVDKGHGFDKGTVTKTYKNVKDSDLATQIGRKRNLSPAAQLGRRYLDSYRMTPALKVLV